MEQFHEYPDTRAPSRNSSTALSKTQSNLSGPTSRNVMSFQTHLGFKNMKAVAVVASLKAWENLTCLSSLRLRHPVSIPSATRQIDCPAWSRGLEVKRIELQIGRLALLPPRIGVRIEDPVAEEVVAKLEHVGKISRVGRYDTEEENT